MKGVVFLGDRKLELREFPRSDSGFAGRDLGNQGARAHCRDDAAGLVPGVGDVRQRSARLSRAGSAGRRSDGRH
jgi:hypothetical protein